ncbi:MAG TPA: TIGR03986 family CRISPR-associated RAMP protein [Kofleriaceae bacterium]|nr:TIGR03986 family CRISPR-associated RAMP protein [Kofleriaceae bacterium]
MPRHINPKEPVRTARAPYNFVPLPERVFTVSNAEGISSEPWGRHDEFIPDTNSGWIDLTIETLTPLYIRGAVSPRHDGSWDTRVSRLRQEPYTTPDGIPAIPGSSLRGMVRTLVEILSFAKIQPVSDAKLFYRSVANDRIGMAYRSRMIRGGQKPQGGILCIRAGSVTISPREIVLVTRSMLANQIQLRNPPDWPPQHSRCWVRTNGARDTVTAIHIQDSPPAEPGWQGGTLVLTGAVPNKKREFVFLDPPANAAPELQVPDAIWRRFHDEDQITQWQEKAFPRDRPKVANRYAAGHLRDGEPVFFLADDDLRCKTNPDGMDFLGRAGMFRLPYDRSPKDLVPATPSGDHLDLAEAIFGKLNSSLKTGSPSDAGSEAIKGRVYFEDAVATDGGPSWYEQVLVPQILSSPKPTTFQHYLTQDGEGRKSDLRTYLHGDQTTIRGHKLYWHRWDADRNISQVRESGNHDTLLNDLRTPNPKDTQHTAIQPVKKGVCFTGRIRFDNLTDLELGALLHALKLPDGCCHRIGMGKPLGLGSIRIRARLQRIDRGVRYRNWQSSGIDENEDDSRFRSAFEKAMLAHARESGEALLQKYTGLRQIGRLDGLFRLLAWDQRPASSSTAYMALEVFKNRPVLPTPHAVAEAPEPAWPQDAPPPDRSANSTERRGGGRGQPRQAPPLTTRDTRPAPRPAPAPATPKPIGTGQMRPGRLRHVGDRWVAVFDGDPREAYIENAPRIPADCTNDTRADFYIVSQSKKDGIRCRFERILPVLR